jgi:hypothetical protein
MYKDQDLITEIEKRFQTLMIGSLSRFEKTFGYLWNHGDEPRSSSEAEFLNKWKTLRNDLLNHGNNQIRLALDELDAFIYENNKFKHQYKFTFNKNQDRR